MGIRMWRALWAVLMLAAAPVAAQKDNGTLVTVDSGTITSPWGASRYVADHALMVRERPAADARIVYDVAPGVILLARASTAGWMQVERAGVRQRRVRGEASLEPVGLKNGKLDIVPDDDAAAFYPVSGYVRADELRDYTDAVQGIRQTLLDVPQPWADLGIVDHRKFVSDPAEHPFDAVVEVWATIKDNGDGTLKVAACTGFVVAPLIVVTSAHCLGTRTNVHVFVHRNGVVAENIIAKIVRAGDAPTYDPDTFKPLTKSGNDNPEDWAILQLTRTPTAQIEPLQLMTPTDVTRLTRAKMLVVGFPGDLHYAAEKRFGQQIPSVSVCDFDPLQSGAQQPGWFNLSMSQCGAWHGNSGGPALLWWNGRYVVAGIETYGKDRGILILTQDAFAAIQQRLMTEASRLENPDLVSVAKPFAASIDTDTYKLNDESTPSVSVVTLAVATHRTEWSIFGVTSYANLFTALSENGVNDTPVWTEPPTLGGGNFLNASHRPDVVFAFDDVKSKATRNLFGWSDEQLAQFGGASADEMPSRWLAAEARQLCVKVCKADLLDPRYQIARSYGDRAYDGDKLDDAIPYGELPYAQLPQGFREALDTRLPDGAKTRLLVVGGDLFITGEDRRIRWAVRDFMGLRGGPFGMVAQADADCGVARKPSDLPTQWGAEAAGLYYTGDGPTPDAIRGATTVSVRQASCVLRRSKPVVLQAIGDRWGVPGAVAVPWAAGGSGDLRDGVAAKLAAEVRRRGGAADPPVLVYCRHEECRLSVNVVKRLVAAGFTHVYWMRDGISGWVMQDAPLAEAEQTPSPLTDGDIAPPAPAAPEPGPGDWRRYTTLDGAITIELPGKVTLGGVRSEQPAPEVGGERRRQTVVIQAAIAETVQHKITLLAYEPGFGFSKASAAAYLQEKCDGYKAIRLQGRPGCRPLMLVGSASYTTLLNDRVVMLIVEDKAKPDVPISEEDFARITGSIGVAR